MFYAYGAFGLGHLRRCMKIARCLATTEPCSILIATNASQMRAVNLPPSFSFLPLAPLIRDIFHSEPNKYHSLTPGLSVQEAFQSRAESLRSAGRAFEPDLVFVDHGATGAERELIPLLEDIDRTASSTRPKLALGLRDIYGSAAWTASDWSRLGSAEILSMYDLILVFGDEKVPTTAQELGLAGKFPRKVHHTGYLGRTFAPKKQEYPDRAAPLILVTPGGGHDGGAFLWNFADFALNVSDHKAFEAMVITGPLFPRSQFDRFKERIEAMRPRIKVARSSRRMESLVTGAQGIICMGGYNSLVEVLSAKVPALVIPRESPSQEQVLRATRLAPAAGLSASPPEGEQAAAISTFVEQLVSRRMHPPHSCVRTDGLTRATQLLDSLYRV